VRAGAGGCGPARAGADGRNRGPTAGSKLDAANVFPGQIVTTLEPLSAFYEAEPYHQNYAARNAAQPYVLFTASPKVAKLKEAFPETGQ
jgi:peptide methionine sulfoxide reductase MsrA